MHCHNPAYNWKCQEDAAIGIMSTTRCTKRFEDSPNPHQETGLVQTDESDWTKLPSLEKLFDYPTASHFCSCQYFLPAPQKIYFPEHLKELQHSIHRPTSTVWNWSRRTPGIERTQSQRRSLGDLSMLLSSEVVWPVKNKNDFLWVCPLISGCEAITDQIETELVATTLENWAQSKWKIHFLQPKL